MKNTLARNTILAACLIRLPQVHAIEYENALYHKKFDWICPIAEEDNGPRQSRLTGVGSSVGVLGSGIDNPSVSKWASLLGAAMEVGTQVRNQHLTQKKPNKPVYDGMPAGYKPAVYVDFYKAKLCPLERGKPTLGKEVYSAPPTPAQTPPPYGLPSGSFPTPGQTPGQGPVQQPFMPPAPMGMNPTGQGFVPGANTASNAIEKTTNVKTSNARFSKKPGT
jgi:hypothetical protein